MATQAGVPSIYNRNQKIRPWPLRGRSVSEVRVRDDQRALADEIAGVAEYARVVGGISRYRAVVLLVLGVPEEYDARDADLDKRGGRDGGYCCCC